MATPFIHEDFLLQSSAARRLYHDYAKELPIIDYHCHLPPGDIARNRRFANLWEVWLEGDHYKWRAMRTNGVSEEFCTGSADPYEKYLAWARTVPKTLRNPLYHWTHLELARYFGITELLDEKSAPRIWQQAQERLDEPDFSVWGILQKFRVEMIGTTDDPLDDLAAHREIASQGLRTRVLPSFRPDKAMQFGDLAAWNAWVDRLTEVSGVATDSWSGFLQALRQRHDFFHANGARISDHGLSCCPPVGALEEKVAAIYEKARRSEELTPAEEGAIAGWLLVYFGKLDAARGWVQQLHLGALRNNSTRQFQRLGRDTGFDSIGDWPQAESLSRFLDALESTGELPKTILYNLNPADNYVFASMIGNFNDGSVAGKVQFGSGWWFLDQREGMEWQLNALSNLGLLSRFVGMLTDSRSFLSYPRHEYFRRLLCDLLGREVLCGALPEDWDLLGDLVISVCHRNAREYFAF